MKSIVRSTVGYIFRSNNKGLRWVTVQLFDPRRPYAHPTEQLQDGFLVPFSLIVIRRAVRKFKVEDPYAPIRLTGSVVDAPALPGQAGQSLDSTFAKLLATFVSTITRTSNRQTMLDPGVPEEILDPLSGNPWLVVKPMVRGKRSILPTRIAQHLPHLSIYRLFYSY